ncbi:hypothetical protein [Olivibacter sitiensis]|uniref:hypothetical protein n=1 Tax=Olivibacter sitiensis TaxID=376470 RepID=UPI0004026C1C|nr:hypothetical protein [Olivibacter sitiensis]
MDQKHKGWVLGTLLCAVGFFPTACLPNKDNEAIPENKTYFDIKGFFLHQADSLQKSNPYIFKEVSQDTALEARKMQIANWQNELDFFISSDINKSDWIGEFRVDSTSNQISYTSKNPEIRTKLIKIKHYKGRLTHIHIENRDSNSLYRSTEHLDYFPDSMYRISKEQHVRLLGEKKYKITGSLNK